VSIYQAVRQARREVVRVRGLDLHLTRWGPEPARGESPVFLLHGWLDCGATFQFLVDAFERDWPLLALDWRGFGQSEWPQEGYWFPDYLADLDALLDMYSPDTPARLVGHSMGGNIASLYAGVRPERVRCVVNLEGVGLPRTDASQGPPRLRKWLDEMRSMPELRDYESLQQLTAIIRHRYPRIGAERAAFVAACWGREADGGRVRLWGDPRHKRINPILYKREDTEAAWRAITAPMLLILGDESGHAAKLGADGTEAAFRALVPAIEMAVVPGAAHLLHIEQPGPVARLVERFLDAH
jgi:pimeloyl-ACP methyl ester carboxylesterase